MLCLSNGSLSLYLLLSWTLDLNFKQLSGNWHNPIVIGSAIYFLLFEWWVSHALFLSVSYFIHEAIKSSKDFPHLDSDWKITVVYLKFIYSEKATKFCKIFTLILSYVVLVKSKVEISQFVAFSEYMNFK